MKLGAERRKLILLGGLLLVAAVLVYTNLFSGDDSSPITLPSPRPAPTAATQPGAAESPRALPPRRPTEFRPSLKRRPDDTTDPAQIDPTVRLDILAKLRNVTLGGTGRNIFEFGAAPPPPPPPTVAVAKRPVEPKIIPQPPPSTPPPPTEIAKPKAPPIPLKFYGLVSTPRGGSRRGFFLDGEDIVVAAEGETIKTRYRVVRIGLNNVEMEDTQFSDRQTLPLEAPGA
jgi:hypothetical protein